MHNDDKVQMSGSIKFARAGPPLQGDMSMITSTSKLLLKIAVFLENIGILLLCRGFKMGYNSLNAFMSARPQNN